MSSHSRPKPIRKTLMSHRVHGSSMLKNLLIKIAVVKLNLSLLMRGMYESTLIMLALVNLYELVYF